MPVIRGVVSDRLWPLVPLEVSGSTGPFWAVIDTGFEGYLMAPDRERARLRVARTSLMMAGVNADGTASLVPQGRIAIRWFGATIMVRAHVPPATMVDGESHRGDPIVGILGLHMLQGMRLVIELYPGRDVIIERAP